MMLVLAPSRSGTATETQPKKSSFDNEIAYFLSLFVTGVDGAFRVSFP